MKGTLAPSSETEGQNANRSRQGVFAAVGHPGELGSGMGWRQGFSLLAVGLTGRITMGGGGTDVCSRKFIRTSGPTYWSQGDWLAGFAIVCVRQGGRNGGGVGPGVGLVLRLP